MKTLLSSLFIALCFGLSAQINYTFSTFTSPYQPLQNATQVEFEEAWDDDEFSVPIGFDFSFLGEVFQDANQVGLGAEFGLSNDEAFKSFGYSTDLIDGAATGDNPSVISYLTTGVPGNRIFKLMYEDAAFYGEIDSLETVVNRVTFQLWMYETDNAWELRFGPSNIIDPQVAYEGFDGPIIAIFSASATTEDIVFLSGDPANPTLEVFNPNMAFEPLSGTPASGRVYRFVPETVMAVSDVVDRAFQIFPTLVNSSLTVNGSFSSNSNYRVFDITGKEVKSGMANPAQTIDVTALRPGVYLFSLDGMPNAQKFVKQ